MFMMTVGTFCNDKMSSGIEDTGPSPKVCLGQNHPVI